MHCQVAAQQNLAYRRYRYERLPSNPLKAGAQHLAQPNGHRPCTQQRGGHGKLGAHDGFFMAEGFKAVDAVCIAQAGIADAAKGQFAVQEMDHRE